MTTMKKAAPNTTANYNDIDNDDDDNYGDGLGRWNGEMEIDEKKRQHNAGSLFLSIQQLESIIVCME